MIRPVVTTSKEILTRAGALVPAGILQWAQTVLNYMWLGRWLKERGHVGARLPDRRAVFDLIGAEIADQKVLYVEFGVYRGDSLRYWARMLRHPESQLHGFDSFEGLPQDFDLAGKYRQGAFDLKGLTPDLSDPRVRLFKGWFHEVLPGYVPPCHDVLMVALDADLYSSTILALKALSPWIRPGTILYFDDLSRVEHEPRAFDEFVKESGRRFELAGIDRTGNCAAFRCVA